MPKLADRTLQAVEKELDGETYKFLLTTSAVEKARRKGWIRGDTEVTGDAAEELADAAEKGDHESLREMLGLVAASRLSYEPETTPDLIDRSMSFFEVVSVFEKISDAHMDQELAEELGKGEGE